MKLKKPKITSLTIQKILLFGFVSVMVFYLGYLFGLNKFDLRVSGEENVTITREVPEEYEDLDFTLFWQVWDTLDNRYYDQTKLNSRDMVYGAIRGMVAAVGDPYTVFLPPEENKVVQEDLKGEFSGVGIQIGFRNNQLAVIAPLPDSPAEAAGVLSGDIIAGIKDEKKEIDTVTTGMSLPEAVQIIRGEPGSTVTLALIRDEVEEPLFVDIKRESIDIPSIVTKFYDSSGNETDSSPKYAHIRLIKFSGDLYESWDEAVREVLKNPSVEGIVLDLRNNPGGFMQGAVVVASDFLEIGDVVVKEQEGDEMKSDVVESIARLRDKELVILVNGGSASASEILSGALRDHLGTPLVGETTFGKGTIQEPQQVENGAGFHITIAKWLTPNETWVNEVGLTPDYEVENDTETEEDEQLLKALEVIREN